MMKLPKFSVIVPIYNVERYLEECILSILNQTFEDFELILVNDGSTDSCPDICRSYEKKDRRIKVIHQTNKGLLTARRVGMQESVGEYLVHIDSDDACKENLLETLDRVIDQYQADLVIYNYDLIDENGCFIRSNPVLEKECDTKIYENLSKKYLLQKIIYGPEMNNIWIKCAHRSIAAVEEDFSSYADIKMGEDVVHTLPLLKNAEKIVYIPDCLYLYRVSRSGMSRHVKKEYIFNYQKVRYAVYRTIREIGCRELEPCFFKRYIHGLLNYLMKMHLICDSSEEYRDVFRRVRSHELQSAAEGHLKYWGIKNFPVYVLCLPCFYGIAKMMAKKYYGTI
ncbi:MAG: glycosyltransferase family 2 protein [Lachnospiraceae bacterium]